MEELGVLLRCGQHTVLEESLSVFVQSGHTECLRSLEKRPRRLQLIYVTNLFPLQPASETMCPPQHFTVGWTVLSCGLLGVAAIGEAALILVA